MNNTGIVAGNQQNNVTDRPSGNRSSFPLSYVLKHTARFGEINCHFSMKGEREDHLPLRSEHDIRTYSFKAPLMDDIEIHKAYFNVPMECILPFNWEKILVQPTIGDDINAQEYGVSVEAFYKKTYDIVKKLWDFAADTNENTQNRANCLFRFMEIGALWYSRGSLMWQMGYHGDLQFLNTNSAEKKYFDKVYDEIIGELVNQLGTGYFFIDHGGSQFYVVNEGHRYLTMQGMNVYSVREFLDVIAHEADWKINTDSSTDTLMTGLLQALDGDLFANWVPTPEYQADKKPINHDRILAYQLVCAHYFSNDAVDYVYSAELYRQNIYSLIDKFKEYHDTGWYHTLNFNYNGISTQVDYLSAAVFNAGYTRFIQTSLTIGYMMDQYTQAYYQYLINIYQFANSLRYRDYFTGARTRPLAVGNVNVNVDTLNQVVSVIDITRNIQVQRFLNSVNRTGRKFANYLEGLIKGKDVGYDYHNPQFLAHVQDKAYAVEIENTGDQQMSDPNSVTSIVKSNSSKYAFEFTPDRPSILIGVEYFDIARSYVKQMDKQIFHVDRFDMFNPDMQYIGDQAVDGAEISMNNFADTFGYQLRYAEYKQRVNQCVGGFVEFLPGYAFQASENKFAAHYANGEVRLSPFYIRSHPFELDSFYISLTGWSPASYFHFIIKAHNDMTASRPMANAPTIL